MAEQYFKCGSFLSESFCTFMGTPIPGCNSPGYFEVFKTFGLTRNDFVEKANDLFKEYNIKVSPDFNVINANEFTICISCCINLKENYDVDVEKIVRNELLKGKEAKDFYHATSLASIALYYLNRGMKVKIIREKDDEPNSDLIINSKKCEIKVIQEADWVTNINPETGKTEEHELFLDVCYDIGNFIAKKGSGYKGIKQSQVIFADLSLKSFGWLKKVLDEEKGYQFPEIKESRIIFFARRILDFTGFYLDFDPTLWKLVKEREIKHHFAVYPFNVNT